MKNRFVFIILLSIFASFIHAKENKVLILDIKEEIAPPVWRKTDKAFKQAERDKVDYIVIHMNTFGGTLDAADKIRTRILESKIPVYVFIDINAASAGALISIACDSIYMKSGATIGAATVVNQTGEVQPDKYQSYMRAMMRATAQAKGRNPDIAEAMVDPRVYIPHINDSGKVLTFTVEEAIANNYCQGKAENIDEVVKKANIENPVIVEQEFTATDKIINFLINPMISGILIMIIIGGIYFELQTPGIGFPLMTAILAAVLFFAPLYLEGLAANWEILVFVVGLILLALEIFIIPGFGVAGVSGIILIVFGLTFSLIDNIYFDFSHVSSGKIMISFSIVVIAITSSIILSFYLAKKLFTNTTTFGALALHTMQNTNEGYSSVDLSLKNMIGKHGVAQTDLRPAGKVMIDNEIYDSTAENGYIEKGSNVLVIKFETAQLFVRQL